VVHRVVGNLRRQRVDLALVTCNSDASPWPRPGDPATGDGAWPHHPDCIPAQIRSPALDPDWSIMANRVTNQFNPVFGLMAPRSFTTTFAARRSEARVRGAAPKMRPSNGHGSLRVNMKISFAT
jgi:hypothetical protein